MATRRKPSPATSNNTADGSSQIAGEKPPAAVAAASEALVLAPPKLRTIAAAMAAFFVLFGYLAFVHYPVDADLRRSITICVAMSLGGFAVALHLIPVAACYLLRRQMFGYDINKKGTPQGAIKV